MHILTYCGLVYLAIGFCIAAPTKPSNGCGYEACNLGDPNKLNVHVIAHSHDDVGWQKTVDEYYYGNHNDVRHAGIQYILDSVVLALDENPDRRFIYVEIAFFWRWWNQQTEDMRNKVRQFVNEGRLEFISGGWCMNDEASTHYNSIIDQHTLGAQFLLDQFGECARPKIGWQIDPFGHSREQASLFAQMGFDGMLFGRADYIDHQQRSSQKKMEMVWNASANLGRQSSLFTGILPRGYAPPDSFCFDFVCTDEPIMDNPALHDYNVPKRVNAFLQYVHNESVGYATNHLTMTMGSDFQYDNANNWFKNLDKLIKYVNLAQANGSDVNVFYSTPACYIYALNKANRTWSSKSDDFFPYADQSHGYWTGYFTSRPALKFYERYSNNILQVTRQLNTFANTSLRDSIFPLDDAMGIVQHHDAVSGTERQQVTNDYALRLSDGIAAAENVINQAYSKLLPNNTQSPPPTPQFLCQLSNISECLSIEGQDRFTVTLWNPTIHPVTHYCRVPVTKSYSIRDPTGQSIVADLIPVSNFTKKIPGRNSTATSQLIFQANLPALGYNTYFFEVRSSLLFIENESSKVKITQNEECRLLNQNLDVEIDGQGRLQQIVNIKRSLNVKFSNQGFYWYQSFVGDNSEDGSQSSGAYVFRPQSQIPSSVNSTGTVTCINGEIVQTAIIAYNDWTSQEMTLYRDADYVEVLWTVGPVPIDDGIGKEIILRYDTGIQSLGKFYTDANGREILERKKDFRPTWNYTVTEPVSGNYYPINSRIWVKDATTQFTVLTDRSHGGSSMQDGSIEIMVHRRILHDDSRGVKEPLNETAYGEGLVVRGRHILIVEQPESSALLHRVISQEFYMHPLATFSLPQSSYANYSAAYRQTWSAVRDTLPLNVHLLTLDQRGAKDYLIRVEHYFELFEDSRFSDPVTIDLQSIFRSIGTISNTVELTLAANLELDKLQRLNWKTNEGETSEMNIPKEKWLESTNVTLIPMQIRTFRVTVS